MLARRLTTTPHSPDRRPRVSRPPSGPTSGVSPLLVGRVFVRLCTVVALGLVCAPVIVVSAVLGLESAPRLLRAYLQASGGLFVKLGQILALRYDLLPARYCSELAKLLDALTPVPTPSIKKVIESSLGKPVGELFVTFEDTPLSCASVAQVHSATLPGGESVVVKVVRPGSEVLFRADLLLVKAGAAVLEFLGIGTRLGLRRLARELAAFTREEFDLIRELRNAEAFETAIRKDGVNHGAPRMYPALSSRSVLTMERIEGVTLSKLVTAVETDDRAQLTEWHRQGIAAEAVASLLLRSMLVQMFRHRTFHADPHSANILVRPGGRVVFVDFGIFGWLDERQWSQQMRMRQALAANRIHAAYAALVADFAFPPGMDVAAFETEMKEILWTWSQASVSPDASILEKSAGALFLRVFDAVRRAGAGIPSGLMRLFRALVISDMVILKLDPAIDLLAEVRQFLGEETAHLTFQSTARGAATAPATLARLVAEAPEVALGALEWLSEVPSARISFHPEPPAAGRLVRILLDSGAMLAGIGTLLAAANQMFFRSPRLEGWFASVGVDVAGHPAFVIVAGAGAFVLLRRLAAAVAR
jgi:ubiquinone biosynthesis protein